jgi:mRNA-degrading endonuclease YafQ of YafQ-DinJ toxin-antitoxin module
VKYRFTATRTFWRSFGKLSAQQQEHARKTFALFKENPFDARLRSHKIHKLSARYARIIYAAEIAANLRVIFYIEGNLVVTVDIGSHDIYRA